MPASSDARTRHHSPPPTIPAAPIAITLFGNGLLAHASSRSLQTVAAGLALTLR